MIRNCQLSTDTIMEEIFFLLMLTLPGFSEGNSYPTTVIVSSTGAAANKQPECLGVYTKITRNWSSRPVWRSTSRDDRFLIYNGKNFNISAA